MSEKVCRMFWTFYDTPYTFRNLYQQKDLCHILAQWTFFRVWLCLVLNVIASNRIGLVVLYVKRYCIVTLTASKFLLLTHDTTTNNLNNCSCFGAIHLFLFYKKFRFLSYINVKWCTMLSLENCYLRHKTIHLNSSLHACVPLSLWYR